MLRSLVGSEMCIRDRFTTVSKGASEYSAKLMEIMKANSTASLDFAQELLSLIHI